MKNIYERVLKLFYRAKGFVLRKPLIGHTIVINGQKSVVSNYNGTSMKVDKLPYDARIDDVGFIEKP